MLLFQILVQTTTYDQGLEINTGGRITFHVRKNFLRELFKNEGSELFTSESTELQIGKKIIIQGCVTIWRGFLHQVESYIRFQGYFQVSI